MNAKGRQAAREAGPCHFHGQVAELMFGAYLDAVERWSASVKQKQFPKITTTAELRRTMPVGRACSLAGMMVAATLCGCALALYSRSAGAAPATTAPPVTNTRAGSVPTCKTNLARQLRVQDVPGLAAAVIKGGRIVCAAVAGMANIEEKKPVTPNTLFMVASVSKTVTATAIMQLYEQGKFQLDDDVNKYLPFEVRIPVAPRSPITFRQLLTHTGSIADNRSFLGCSDECDFFTRGADSPLSLANLIKGYLTPGGAYYDKEDNFEAGAPGTINKYSNMGAVLLGYLVEVISGTPFDKYCEENIFKPLGMNKTSWRLAGIDMSLLAMPYDGSFESFEPHGQYGEANYPDGMLRTSVVELAHFLIAYMQGGAYAGRQILKSTTVQEMLKNQTSLDSSQGLVWFKDSVDERVVWGHNGGDRGARAEMWFEPKSKEGVILVSNGSWDDSNEIIASLFREADAARLD